MHYSAQREIVYEVVSARCDHPTALQVYVDCRAKWPKISLGTVYRDLAFLVDAQRLSKVSTPGADHYEADTSTHPHFLCTKCGKVVNAPASDALTVSLPKNDWQIESCSVIYSGVCPSCK